jgi:thiosulfate/3-mercaptopyruvate sulfurtransferase
MVPGPYSRERLNFVVSDAARFAKAASAAGIGDGLRVVLYDRALNRWAARMWWMLRAFGFDSVAVLDGGWCKWVGEGRRASTDPCRYQRARFVPRPRGPAGGPECRGCPCRLLRP